MLKKQIFTVLMVVSLIFYPYIMDFFSVKSEFVGIPFLLIVILLAILYLPQHRQDNQVS